MRVKGRLALEEDSPYGFANMLWTYEEGKVMGEPIISKIEA